MVPDPYGVAEKLWKLAWAENIDLTDKTLEVDAETLYTMRKDWDLYRRNFQMIAPDGKPTEEYRDGWTVRVVRHIDLPPVLATYDSDVDLSSRDGGETPHMALVATKPSGRQIAFDWEHNHKDLT